jgi:hypothetical protein
MHKLLYSDNFQRAGSSISFNKQFSHLFVSRAFYEEDALDYIKDFHGKLLIYLLSSYTLNIAYSSIMM